MSSRPEPSTREMILSCSRRLFSQRSSSQVTIKDIAEQAGVSSALVIKYFLTKENLFEQTINFSESARRLFSGEFSQLGQAAVYETLTAPEDAPYSTVRTLVIGSGDENSLKSVGAKIQTDLKEVLVERIEKEAPHPYPHPQIRAQAALSLIIGLSVMRRVGDPNFREYPRRELLDYYAAQFQQIVDGMPQP
ncbi:TetR/AcrR family transcriptional regulator [Corynebacterium flavescens]|uniref:TetR/AcrR family transcriptional regulator n=1 Tax=Corynebacterium flavescens TaxID=28028 RepID=UPI003FD515EF